MTLNAKELLDNNEILPYKSKIMNILLSSETLYELVTNKPCEDIELAENLIGKNYVPHLFVEDTITETQAYVLFDIDQHSVIKNANKSTYGSYDVCFQILCHKKIYMVDSIGATRCDCIVAELCRLFKDKLLSADGSLSIGTNQKVSDSVLIAPNNDFVARELIFRITDFDERVKKRYG